MGLQLEFLYQISRQPSIFLQCWVTLPIFIRYMQHFQFAVFLSTDTTSETWTNSVFHPCIVRCISSQPSTWSRKLSLSCTQNFQNADKYFGISLRHDSSSSLHQRLWNINCFKTKICIKTTKFCPCKALHLIYYIAIIILYSFFFSR